MTGYRNLHREKIERTAIWHVATSSPLMSSAKKRAASTSSVSSLGNTYRIWTASADGFVRSYIAKEKSLEEKQHDDSVLDASALTLTCTHCLFGNAQQKDSSTTDTTEAAIALGCTRVCVARNYVGDDDEAGDLLVASLEMSGIVRIWILSENEDDEVFASNDTTNTTVSPKAVRAAHEFQVENATGTVMVLCPPSWGCGVDVTVAVGCLDGTVAQIATGIVTPQRLPVDASTSDSKAQEATPAGTIVDRWGSSGSSIPLSIVCHPQASGVFAVGRQNGQLDVLTNGAAQQRQNQQQQRRHRLQLPGNDNDDVPIRAVIYTPDGNLLAAGNDAGMLAVWDVSRPAAPPTLVHHVVQAHASWILDITALPDSRRWVTCGADRKLHVWKIDQMYQSLHTFDSDQTVWTLAVVVPKGQTISTSLDKSKTVVRMMAGTETGLLQVLSLDG